MSNLGKVNYFSPLKLSLLQNSFSKRFFSQIETYKVTDGKVEAGLKVYEYGHGDFNLKSVYQLLKTITVPSMFHFEFKA